MAGRLNPIKAWAANISNAEAAIAIAISLQFDLVRILSATIQAEGLRVSAPYNR